MISVRFEPKPYRLGDEVTGEVHWTAEKSCTPRKIIVSLGWRTEGRGDVNRETVATAEADGKAMVAEEMMTLPFRVRIPETAVPSFAGNLIRLVWFIGVRIDLPWAFDETTEIEVPVVAHGRNTAPLSFSETAAV